MQIKQRKFYKARCGARVYVNFVDKSINPFTKKQYDYPVVGYIEHGGWGRWTGLGKFNKDHQNLYDLIVEVKDEQ
jgi:hypothetical protein